MRLAIRSEALIVKDGKILTEHGNLIGDWIKEGEDSEEVCIRKAKEKNIPIKIVKPLHPMIRWAINHKGEKYAILNLSYLARLEEEDGR